MSLLSVIASNSTAIYAVCIPGLLLSAGYVGWRTLLGGGEESRAPLPTPHARTTPRRPMAPPTPSIKPRSLEVGMAEHQVRGEAKTVKVPGPGAAPLPPVRDERKTDTARVPAVDMAEDDAKDSLFSGLGEKPADAKDESTAVRKAERMEELGFHKQAQNQPTSEAGIEKQKTELLKSLGGPVTTPDTKRAETRTGTEAITVASAPRTQTQELDDILSRIDKVLAENPVMATMTLGSNSAGDQGVPVKPVPPKPKPPVIAEQNPGEVKPTDAKTDDGSGAQQKLF